MKDLWSHLLLEENVSLQLENLFCNHDDRHQSIRWLYSIHLAVVFGGALLSKAFLVTTVVFLKLIVPLSPTKLSKYGDVSLDNYKRSAQTSQQSHFVMLLK